MSQTPRLVLFDLVGTLLRVETGPEPYWIPISEAISQAGLGAAEEFDERYAAMRRKWHDEEIEVPLRDRLTRFLQVPHELSADLERQFMVDYTRRTSVTPGAGEMLGHWESVSTLGVVSNFFVAGAPRQLLEHHGLLRHFAFVVDSATVGYRKPHSKIFERALSDSGIDATPRNEVLMIGDDWRADVEGALEYGFGAAHFSALDPRRQGVRRIESWHDFRPAAWQA